MNLASRWPDTAGATAPADQIGPTAATVAIPYGWFEPGHRAGGVVTSLVRLLDTADDDVLISVLTRDRDLGAKAPYPGLSGATVHRGRHRITYLGAAERLLALRVLAQLRREGADVLYLNGLFSVPFSIVPLLAVKLRLLRPRVLLIAPRGSFSAGALEIHGRRKDAFLRLVRGMGLASGAVFHASSAMESDEIARHFPAAVITVCEDQVAHPVEPAKPEASGDGLRLVFISRISPKKNLLGAVQALARVTSKMTFDIYGPVEDVGYWAQCQAAIARLPRTITVSYGGELQGDRVVGTFGQYDAFLFPSRGENFGHVIAESLAASCYVITTPHSPWAGWLGRGGFVAPDRQSLAAEVERIASLGASERHALRMEAHEAYQTRIELHRNENVLTLVCSTLLANESAGGTS